MSKKKAKTTAKGAQKAAKRAPMKKAASSAAGATKRTAAATIFVYDAGGETRVRTSPQLLSCGNGYVEWTVVNLTSAPMPDVDITWVDGSPWGGAPIPIRGGNRRVPIDAGAQQGRFKYNVTCNGYTEDPEVEYPEQ
jgi:hypothetical protein